MDVDKLGEHLRNHTQGGDAYQSAYYVYDEIAQMPNANNAIVLNGKAIAQAAMGHWPEADAALTEAKGLVCIAFHFVP